MADRRLLELTSEQHQTLEEGRDHHPRPFVRERCAALLKIAAGKSPHWVARFGLLKERDPDTVYAWLSRSQQEGLAGILFHRPGAIAGSVPDVAAEVTERLQRAPGEEARIDLGLPDEVPPSTRGDGGGAPES